MLKDETIKENLRAHEVAWEKKILKISSAFKN